MAVHIYNVMAFSYFESPTIYILVYLEAIFADHKGQDYQKKYAYFCGWLVGCCALLYGSK